MGEYILTGISENSCGLHFCGDGLDVWALAFFDELTHAFFIDLPVVGKVFGDNSDRITGDETG